MSKAKAIGTKAETAVRNYLLSFGYSELDAHRNVLTGADDQGDVWLREATRGLIVFEVKGGQMAKNASYDQCVKWLEEAERERSNAQAAFGFLVTQRAGVGYPRAGEWWAYARLDDILRLCHGGAGLYPYVVRLTLRELVELING